MEPSCIPFTEMRVSRLDVYEIFSLRFQKSAHPHVITFANLRVRRRQSGVFIKVSTQGIVWKHLCLLCLKTSFTSTSFPGLTLGTRLRLHVHGRLKRRKKYLFSKISGYLWKGPRWLRVWNRTLYGVLKVWWNVLLLLLIVEEIVPLKQMLCYISPTGNTDVYWWARC